MARHSFLACALVVAGAAASASAQELLTFGFTQLNGSYDATTAKFHAVASNTPELQTTGDVTRIITPSVTAIYGPGLPESAVDIKLDVSSISSPQAIGTGTVTVLDRDGDTLTGDVVGEFREVGAFIFFNGLMNNVFIQDGGTPDLTWDGFNGGSFQRDLGTPQPFEGTLVQLYLSRSGAFFGESFERVPVQTSAIIVPAPAGFAAIVGGLMLAGRRRRA